MLAAALVFLLGACIGSFTNVLVLRLPASESVVRPGSRCPSCLAPVAWYDNIPIVSYIALRGRCRRCRARISAQYPLVELIVGLLFLGNFLLFSRGPAGDVAGQLSAVAHEGWITGAVFTTLLFAIALTDVRTYLIPDELSIGGMLIGLTLSLLPGGLTPLNAFLGAFAGAGLLLGVAWVGSLVFGKEAMGGGDIKMLAMIGAFVGWTGVLLTLFLGALLGSVIYGPISIWHRRRQAAVAEPEGEMAPADTVGERSRARNAGAERKPEPTPDLAKEASGSPEEMDRGLVPFGFFLAPAAALTFYLEDEIVRGYLRLVGLEG